MSDSVRAWVHYGVVSVVVVLFMATWWSADCDAQEHIRHDAEKPVKIISDSLEADDNQGVFTFSGNVVARQDGAVIYADHLDVYYSDSDADSAETETSKQAAPRSIERIIARGAVKIVQEDRIARGERADYDYATRAVVLTGSPSVVQGGNSVAGEKITVFIGDERSIVEGGNSERVEAVFVPGSTQ